MCRFPFVFYLGELVLVGTLERLVTNCEESKTTVVPEFSERTEKYPMYMRLS